MSQDEPVKPLTLRAKYERLFEKLCLELSRRILERGKSG